MSLSLFLVDEQALSTAEPGDVVPLSGAEGHHAVTVARTKPGERLLLGDGIGTLARCRVSAVDTGRLEAEVEDIWFEPPAQPSLTVVQALAKGDRDLLAVEVATELGVDEVVPWQADRSVVRWRGDRGRRSQQKWGQTLVSATKQARRARIPTLAQAAGREQVRARIAGAARAWVLHESAEVHLADVVSSAGAGTPRAGEVVLVVGPEGGISQAELDAFVDAGAEPVVLGPTVLRTSTAGSAGLAVICAASRWRA